MLFAREGARVMLVDRAPGAAEETQAIIGGEGGEAFAFRADVTVAAECRAAAEACVARWGRVDILHNNVGIAEGDRGLTRLTEEAWQRIMDVNAKSVLLMCQAVMPYLAAQGSGAIINISSVAAVCSVNMLAYKTSKAGVNALTQALAMGAAPKGVRVNAIMPGLIDTPMAIEGWARARGMERERIIAERNARVPLKGGMGTAWDVAYAALFLASDEAKFVTGVVLPVDGGQIAQVG